MFGSRVSEYSFSYKIINQHSSFVTGASTSLAGGLVFGTQGFFYGLSVDIADNLLIHYRYTSERIFGNSYTAMLLGHSVYPSLKFTSIIGIISFICNSKIIDCNDEKFKYILASMLLGVKNFGTKGALISITLGTFDYLLLQYNLTDKCYFSSTMISTASLSILFGTSFYTDVVGISVGIVFASYKNLLDFNYYPIVVGTNLLNIYSNIINDEALKYFFQEYCIILLNTQIITNQIRNIFLQYEQKAMYIFEHMDIDRNGAILSLTSQVYKFCSIIFPFVATEIIINILNNFYTAKLYIEIDNKLRETLYSNETALKLLINKNNTILIENLNYDSKIISKDGIKIISGSIATHLEGIFGISVLIVNSPEMLIYTVFYNKFMEFVSHIITEKINFYEIKVKELEATISNMYKNDMNNIKVITENKDIAYAFIDIQKVYDQLRENELPKEQMILLLDGVKTFRTFTNFILTYYLIGLKIGQGTLEFDNRAKVHLASIQVSKLLFWAGENSQQIKKIDQSVERLFNFLNKTQKESSLEYMQVDYFNGDNSYKTYGDQDNIKRYTSLISDKLILSNLSISIMGRQLIKIDYLEFKLGARYVIEGNSGSGKTSLISKINSVLNNGVNGEGDIYYPQGSIVKLVNQQSYFPLNKSFLEVIFYPSMIDYNKLPKIIELLSRLKLEEFNLEQKYNWGDVLSGEQKQKVKFISAIIQKPNILILDEVFNGLDKESIKTVQKILLEEMYNSLIISIDHKSKENNNFNFYQERLLLSQGKLIQLLEDRYFKAECPNYIKDYEMLILGDGKVCYE